MAMTVNQIQTAMKAGYNTGLLETCLIDAGLDFLEDGEFGKIADGILVMNHADRVCELGIDTDDYQKFKQATDIFLMGNAYKYKTLFDTITLEYNPIENYNGVEIHTETHSGEDKNNYGAKTDTQTTPEIKVTNQYGKQVSTTGITAFDRTTFKDAEQTTQDIHSDSTTQAPVTTSLTSGAKTDTLEHGHVIKHEIKKSGNIGVTTSQQMLQSSRDIASFSLAQVIVQDWLDTFALAIWLPTPESEVW